MALAVPTATVVPYHYTCSYPGLLNKCSCTWSSRASCDLTARMLRACTCTVRPPHGPRAVLESRTAARAVSERHVPVPVGVRLGAQRASALVRWPPAGRRRQPAVAGRQTRRQRAAQVQRVHGGAAAWFSAELPPVQRLGAAPAAAATAAAVARHVH